MKYQDDGIASDSDDPKKIRAAESRALRKQKSSSYQENRGYGEYNVAYDSVARASSSHNSVKVSHKQVQQLHLQTDPNHTKYFFRFPWTEMNPTADR